MDYGSTVLLGTIVVGAIVRGLVELSRAKADRAREQARKDPAKRAALIEELREDLRLMASTRIRLALSDLLIEDGQPIEALAVLAPVTGRHLVGKSADEVLAPFRAVGRPWLPLDPAAARLLCVAVASLERWDDLESALATYGPTLRKQVPLVERELQALLFVARGQTDEALSLIEASPNATTGLTLLRVRLLAVTGRSPEQLPALVATIPRDRLERFIATHPNDPATPTLTTILRSDGVYR